MKTAFKQQPRFVAFQQEKQCSTTISKRRLENVCDSLFNKHWVHPWSKVFALFPLNAVTQIHRGSCMAFPNYIKASDYLFTWDTQHCSISQSPIHTSALSLFSLLFFSPHFFFYSPHLPSGEMVWPFWSKQALITPWEGIVWGTAHSIWRGPHRGTWEQEIDAVGVRGVTAPYGTCTAPADGVSVSTLGKCVKDSEKRRWDFGLGWNTLL